MSKFFSWVLLLASLFASISATAQNAVLQGKITDRENGEPLPGANVSIGGGGTVSDFDGSFSLSSPAGNVEVTVSFVGYQTVKQNITLASGETRTLDFALEIETSVLKTATVTSGKFARPLSEETVSIEVLKPSLINNTGKVSLDKALEKIP
ncbi:MAG TPA: carboxypeptidase-like regulatory domain-containing protein, partial [Saprospiraceae bacterium]|nr:carboxypeptidase-like regulatory domain-containing protein [Saprospiraceae bacterium]